MASRLLIELDERSVRVARATWDARHVHLHKAFQLEIAEQESPKTLGQRLRAELQKQGLGKGDADLILNRRAVELREIALPPAPDEELPDLLKYSARNEFAAVNDAWCLDFVPLSDDPAKSRQVLAGALSPQLLAEYKTLGEAAGLRIQRILLRPFCVAQAVVPAASRPVLIVHSDRTALDLTLASGGRVWMTRTVKLQDPAGPGRVDPIVREVLRSMMLAQRTAGGREPAQAVLIAPGSEWQLLADALSEKLSIPVKSWQELDDRGGLSRGLNIESADEYLAHYGAALGSMGRGWPTVDFGNPRRRVEKQTDYRRMALWGGLAAILLLAAGAMAWLTLSSQTEKIQSLAARQAELKKANDDAGVDQIVGEVELVDQWARDNINWMEELKQVSERLLTADDAIVSYFKGGFVRDVPEVLLRGRLTSRDTNSALMANLASRPYEVDQRRSVRTTDSSEYPHEFEYALFLDRTGVNVAAEIARKIREESAESRPVSDGDSPSANPPESAQSPDSSTDLDSPN